MVSPFLRYSPESTYIESYPFRQVLLFNLSCLMRAGQEVNSITYRPTVENDRPRPLKNRLT